jgi:hypothetical protein
MMDPDRAKLQIAAVFGGVFGILTGYVVGHPPFGILIWGLIGAASVPGRSTVIGHLGNASGPQHLWPPGPRHRGHTFA